MSTGMTVVVGALSVLRLGLSVVLYNRVLLLSHDTHGEVRGQAGRARMNAPFVPQQEPLIRRVSTSSFAHRYRRTPSRIPPPLLLFCQPPAVWLKVKLKLTTLQHMGRASI